jgi:SAM-dependent methyltransferase
MKFINGLLVLLTTFSTAAQKDHAVTSDTVRPSLTEMCERYPTDKCPYAHGFIEIYDRLFESERDSMERFFEIGILNGVSHLMWREYFPNAEIFGIDIKDYSAQSKGTGIETFVADQANRNDLKAFIDKYGGNFDVILDDGGHAMDHQQVSLGYLFQHVKSGGIFIIEDVHTSLPDLYPDPFFEVAEDEMNTTLLMIEYFIRTGKIRSQYMTNEEIRYLEENILSIELHHRVNSKHSILAIIRKN